MESRKMALLKLFAGNNGETDREQTYGHGKKQVGCMGRVTWKLILPFVK